MSNSLSRRSFVTSTALLGLAGATAGSVAALASEKSDAASNSAAVDSSSNSASTDTQTTDQEIDCDFVVVGAGMAGYCAVIKAAEQGVSNIVLLEKNNSVGGSTLYAEGIFGNGDSYQKDAGYDPADLDSILQEEIDWSHGVVNRALFSDYLAGSGDYIDWLMDKGVTFQAILDANTGNYCMHNYTGGNGASAIDALSSYAKEQYGIEATLETPAIDLIMEDGACKGVRARTADGTLIDYKAPTVCLATGGIASNDEMMDEYTKLEAGKWRHLGNAGQDGDAITMVEKTAHGHAKNVCACNMWLTVGGAAPTSVVNNVAGQEGTNIWINQDGQRFADESIAQNFFVCNNQVVSQGKAYSLFDQDHVDFFKENGTTCFWSGFCLGGKPIDNVQDELDTAAADDSIEFTKCDTLEEAAEYMGVDAQALTNTVNSWNSQVDAGADSDFGKSSVPLCKVATAPFYVGHLVTGVLNSFGGVRIDRTGCVITPDGTQIDGLYAAGIAVSGLSGEVYGMAAPGSNQGPAAYFGRLAGDAAAQRA